MNNTTMQEYFLAYPASTQAILNEVRTAALKAAPGAEEAMKYGMPTLVFNGKNLVHYAAWEKHIGFYPTPSALVAFKDDIAKYKSSKGAVQFPIEKPMPIGLITKMVKYRVKEITEKYGLPKKKK